MINSRKITDLHPTVAEMCRELIAECEKVGIDLLITSTYRDHESQSALYEKGRSLPGPKVTNAKPGDSMHNWRVAFDVVPLVDGKATWNDAELWKRVGQLGVSVGLEWAGNWRRFKEMPHFQFTNKLTIADFKAGKTI